MKTIRAALLLLAISGVSYGASCGAFAFNPIYGTLDCVGSSSGGGVAFSAITSATNTTAAMVVGTGATLTYSGSGTINASTIGGSALGATTPTSGNILIGSGLLWATKAVSGVIAIDSAGVTTCATCVSTGAGATFGAFAYDFTASTVSLPAVFARTDTAQSWTAGATQTFVPSATLFGLKVSCTTLPSTAASAGGIGCNAAGAAFFNDGANIQALVEVNGSGATAGTIPTAGRIPIWNGTNYSLGQDSDINFSGDTLTVTKIVGTTYIAGPADLTTGTTKTFSLGSGYFECTGTCTITMPVPVVGSQYCVRNANNVATVITFAAVGSSARYEVQAHTSYGTAGTGTFVSGGSVSDQVCLVGKDSTHYDIFSIGGTWTAN